MSDRFLKAFVYRTRGLYPALGAFGILFLKHVTTTRVGLDVFILSIIFSIPPIVLREWAAGFLGGAVRSSQTEATVFVTAGPYAYVRHPIYLASLLLGLTFGLMSGLWYSYPIILALFGFLYFQIVPYEESFLLAKFGRTYKEYQRAVRALIPTPSARKVKTGIFRLADLKGEVPVLLSLPFLWLLYWIL